ncbi:hypothetical protein [Agromyces seonyuensis]|uniref:Uncharacterized protein n=1 Tax=Agromyces seonyuensis TaxID=2662446 RepID=A0A6I4P3A2_9MICO|nr:hypothetical protein [Agromyces seonyuensis]MWB98649.1 hypothetical protein [Agromyces seonyuensis]
MTIDRTSATPARELGTEEPAPAVDERPATRTAARAAAREAEARGAAAAEASGPASSDPDAGQSAQPTQRELLARQRRRFGGVKVGSALFGWLAATGTAAVLLALVAAAGALLGYDAVPGWIGTLDVDAETIGWLGAGLVLVGVFLSYFAGGYVAGRMARFDGAVQGVAVWTWALVIAIVAALASVLLDGRTDLFANLGTLPRIPLSDGEFTVLGLSIAVLAALTSLGGAVLGGIAGTQFHRRVDRVALRG